MPQLTNQEKLALMMTGHRSMRSLAAQLGATHQQVGRWLRNEAKRGVPDSFVLSLNTAFSVHKQSVKKYSKANRIPYIPDAPVLLQRPTLNNGKPGERLIAVHTEFLLPPFGSGAVMRDFLIAMRNTGEIQAVSVRSVIDLYSYLGVDKKKGSEYLADRFRNHHPRDNQNRKTLRESFLERETVAPGQGFVAPIYTKITQFSKHAPIKYSLDELAAKLTQKHQPHAITFADQLLIQTVPNQYEKGNKTKTAAKKRAYLKRK